MQRMGIATWVMRKHSYAGALIAQHGYLMVITLRHATEVIPPGQLEPPQGRPLTSKESDMARSLIKALSERFQPEKYHDEYEARIRELVAAKQAGKRIKPKRLQRRRQGDSLEASLRASLEGLSARRRK